MRLVGSSLSDINFQCLKQWFLKLIHFHRFFEVLAICRKYQITDFKYIFFSSQKKKITEVKTFHVLNSPWISSFPPLMWRSTLCSLYSIGRWQTPVFQNLDSLSLGYWGGLTFEWSGITSTSLSTGRTPCCKLYLELILYESFVRYLHIRRDYRWFIFCINSNPKWVTIIYQQMAVLAWVTANVTIKRDTPVTHPWRVRIHHCFWWDMVRDTKTEWFCTEGPLSTKTDFCC